jgi:hypothetical protein
LVVTSNPAYTTHRTETPCAKVQEPTPVRREKLEAQKRSTHGVPFTSVVILSRLKDGEGSQRYQGHRSIRRAPELKNNRLLVFAELLA